MRFTLLALMSVVIGLGIGGRSVACGDIGLDESARDAISRDEKVSARAIAELRANGSAGLDAMLATHADAIKKYTSRGGDLHDENWQRLRKAIDQVAQQRDAYVSRLFWYTDFDQAAAASKSSGKPILSLRMLGKLCDEYSCANSRFFRTTLYSNAEVSQYMREHFILHWKSVRPVPVVTIDMGDGRTIKRTITGNSIHYVLASDGKVIDGLPGLYGPSAFLSGLKDAEVASANYAKADPGAKLEVLRKFHVARGAAIEKAWIADLQKVGVASPVLAGATKVGMPNLVVPAAIPPAELAAIGQQGKGRVEQPLVRAVQPMAANPIKATAAMSKTDNTGNRELLDKATNDNAWVAIAALPAHVAEAQFDASTTGLFELKNPEALAAAQPLRSKAVVETPLIRAMRNLQRSIAEDTVRNEYRVHWTLHQWLAGNMATMAVDPLNEKIYADLFLSPSSDPWLGLVPNETLSALDDEGLCR